MNHKILEWINTIQCLDCLDGISQIPDKSIDLVLADPPYGISRELNCKDQRLGSTAKLNFNFGEWDKVDMQWIDLILPKVNGWFMAFCAKRDIGIIWEKLEEDKFVAIDALVWQKPDPLPLNAKSRFVNAWESIVAGKRPGAYWSSNYKPNIFNFQAPKGTDRIHKTQKPVGLIKELILLTTQKDDLVLDPFMGSGTTAVACQELGRNFIGFEISSENCEQAVKRLKYTTPYLL
jgi:DNA modification methylase